MVDDGQARMMATEQEVPMMYLYRAAYVKTELVDHYCQAGAQLRAPEFKLVKLMDTGMMENAG